MTKHPHETDVAFIQALAELLNKNDLTELAVMREYGENDSLDVRVVKQAPAVAAPAPVYAAAPVPASAASGAPAAPAASEDPARHPGAVASPMVGTVYLAAEPGAAPFVSVGDAVKEGQTLLIVEAMKTMNPIQSPRDGVVVEILVGDAQPVEYGEALVLLEA